MSGKVTENTQEVLIANAEGERQIKSVANVRGLGSEIAVRRSRGARIWGNARMPPSNDIDLLVSSYWAISVVKF